MRRAGGWEGRGDAGGTGRSWDGENILILPQRWLIWEPVCTWVGTSVPADWPRPPQGYEGSFYASTCLGHGPRYVVTPAQMPRDPAVPTRLTWKSGGLGVKQMPLPVGPPPIRSVGGWAGEGWSVRGVWPPGGRGLQAVASALPGLPPALQVSHRRPCHHVSQFLKANLSPLPLLCTHSHMHR